MNENEFDATARAWLEDGPTRMPERGLVAALEEIHTTRQRRAMWSPWRPSPVSRFAGMAVAAVLVVAVGVLAVNVVPRGPAGPAVGGSSSSPSPEQSLHFPELTQAFVSPRYGFSVQLPGRVAVTRAEQLWGFANPAGKDVDAGFDVVETGLAAVFKGASIDVALHLVRVVPSGSNDERVDEFLSDDNVLPDGCGIPRSRQVEITIDGRPGRIAECGNHIEATVFSAGRLYLFALSHDRSDARAVFDAFLATIDLTPETVPDFPALTATFVSPTNGYAFGYVDRGGLEPATGSWDPVNQPPLDESELGGAGTAWDAFDVVETGYAAAFMSASTPVPDGVAIDEWVDAAVMKYLPAGCHVPRTEQEPISIDGQPGRISEDCEDTVVATTVAGGRLYLFMLGRSHTDARAFFNAWVDTIDLRPEDAPEPSSASSS